MSKEDELIKEQKKRFSDDAERWHFYIAEKIKYFEATKVPTDDKLFEVAYDISMIDILPKIWIPKKYNTEDKLKELVNTIGTNTITLYNDLLKKPASLLVSNYPEIFESSEFWNFTDSYLKPLDLFYGDLRYLSGRYSGKKMSDEFIKEVEGTGLEGLMNTDWMSATLDTLKYKFVNSKYGAKSDSPYSDSKINENIKDSLMSNISEEAKLNKKLKEERESAINLANEEESDDEFDMEEPKSSPINESKPTTPTPTSSTINQESSGEAKPETTTSSSVTSGTIELPKEPVESKESPVINISLENKEKPTASSSITNIGSPINETSENTSVSNTNTKTSDSSTSTTANSVINQGSSETTNVTNIAAASPAVANETVQSTPISVGTAPGSTQTSESNVSVSNNTLNQTSEKTQPVSNINETTTSNTTSPININETNVESNIKLPEAFSSANISKLYSALKIENKSAINPVATTNSSSNEVSTTSTTQNVSNTLNPGAPTQTANQVNMVSGSVNESSNINTSNSTNPVNETVTNNTENSIKKEAFNPKNVSKLYNALNLNASTGTQIAQLGDITKNESSVKNEGSTVNIPGEESLNQPEVTKIAPSFSEKIQAAAPIVSPIKKLEETTNISTTEITNAPSKEIVTSSTTSEKTETSAPAPTSMGGVSIDLGPLEQRMARIEYLLSNTLEVKLID